ncbi:MAG: hypothetical protein ACT4PL_13825 [Phycisphaerales bacterium]
MSAEGVRRAFLARAAQAHPDRGAAEGEAAELNRARAALDDPESRAGVLLQRLGGASKEQDRSLPEGFLVRVMALREGLAEAQGAGGLAVEQAILEAESQREGHMVRCAALFEDVRRGAGGEATLREIRRELNAWRYVERLIEQLGSGDGAGAAG